MSRVANMVLMHTQTNECLQKRLLQGQTLLWVYVVFRHFCLFLFVMCILCRYGVCTFYYYNTILYTTMFSHFYPTLPLSLPISLSLSHGLCSGSNIQMKNIASGIECTEQNAERKKLNSYISIQLYYKCTFALRSTLPPFTYLPHHNSIGSLFFFFFCLLYFQTILLFYYRIS